MAEFADYVWLTSEEGARWLATAADDDRTGLKLLTALRKDLSAERATLVAEQLGLRKRAVEKFGELARQMFFTRTLLEQASDFGVAAYKGLRLRRAAGEVPVHDICCGIGGDLMAFAMTGPAGGYDKSPIACLLATTNVAAVRGDAADRPTIAHDVEAESLELPVGEPWHVDPDRRATGKRTTTVESFSPGLELVDRWRGACPEGAVKLAPASTAPDRWDDAEREWITTRRECRQQVVWFGNLAIAPAMHRATALRVDGVGGSLAGTFAAAPNMPADVAEEPDAFVFDPDPSVLASRLLGALAEHHGLATLGAGGGYLTGGQFVDDGLLSAYTVEEVLPLRTAAIAGALKARGVGRVEIKKRGVLTDPEKLRRELKLAGDGEITLILTRIGAREIAIVAKRVHANS